MTDNEEKKMMNLMSDIKDIDNEIAESLNNPYAVDPETAQMLLEFKKKSFCESNNNISTTGTIITAFDTVSTIKSLKDNDKGLVENIQ